ncbi:tRNA lysidine(34) synthetase TilS [SAR202 cluster bacterium AD-804-J14_MRT_500m]|nr:tRNA lysidine(34) synthetase TilS [SAR202 cluster bacterium AD-804-J14_MRT_500m]
MPIQRYFESALNQALIDASFSSSPLRLLVAVSGGPDSMALLHGLVNLRYKSGISIHVANLNHELRGKDSDSDSQLVHDISAQLKVSCTIKTQSVATYQKRFKISSTELAAREIRYHFLANLATQQRCDAIVLGHTADDQAETILMNLIRGSGLQGLTGMALLSKWSGTYRDGHLKDPQTTLFRPLLTMRKSDTLAYCTNLNIPFRKDSSNASSTFTRGRIRNDLLPNLRNYNPQAVDAILRVSRSAQIALEYLEREADVAWGQSVTMFKNGVAIDISQFNNLHPALMVILLRRAYAEATGGIQALSETQLLTMIQLLGKNSVSNIDLPFGISFKKEGTQATLTDSTENIPSRMFSGEHKIMVPGVSFFPHWRVTSTVIERSALQMSPNSHEIVVDAHRLGDNPVVRTRRGGDKFWPMGMPKEIKLNRFFINSKIPRIYRSEVPLLITDMGIQWVVGHRISDRVKITSQTSKIIKIKFSLT